MIPDLKPLYEGLAQEDPTLTKEQSNLVTQLFKVVYGHQMERSLGESGWVTLMREHYIVNREVYNGEYCFLQILNKITPEKLCLRPDEGVVEDCFTCVDVDRNSSASEVSRFGKEVYALSADPNAPPMQEEAETLITILTDLMTGNLVDIFGHLTFGDEVKLGMPSRLGEVTRACFMLCERARTPNKEFNREEYDYCMKTMNGWVSELFLGSPSPLDKYMASFAEELVALVYCRFDDFERPVKGKSAISSLFLGLIARFTVLRNGAASMRGQLNSAVFQAFGDIHDFFTKNWNGVKKQFYDAVSALRGDRAIELTVLSHVCVTSARSWRKSSRRC